MTDGTVLIFGQSVFLRRVFVQEVGFQLCKPLPPVVAAFFRLHVYQFGKGFGIEAALCLLHAVNQADEFAGVAQFDFAAFVGA